MADEEVVDTEVQVTDTTPEADAPAPTLRDQLNAAADQHREKPPGAPETRDPKGKFVAKDPAKEQTDPVSKRAAKPAADASEAGEPGGASETTSDVESKPPGGWPKDSAELWKQIPAAAQAVVAKRLDDAQKGVEKMKTHYGEIDGALQPHLDVIRQHGHTPGAAVKQLFGWFQALASNPAQAFPALAKSFNVDLNTLVAPQTVPSKEPSEPAPGAVPPGEPPYVAEMRKELAELKNGFGSVQSTFAAQNEAKTHEVISNWAEGKTHFPVVRNMMAQLIASGAVPLKDGRVDLDGAYSMAVYANPEVRELVLAEVAEKKAADAQKAAEKTRAAQAGGANNARRAAVSVQPGAPGRGSGTKAPSTKPGATVRESILAAVNEAQA